MAPKRKHTNRRESSSRRSSAGAAKSSEAGADSFVSMDDMDNFTSDVAYPKLRYSLERTKPLLYNEAVENVRSMFVQQSELWKRQANEMDLVIATLEGKEKGTELSANYSEHTESEALLASRRENGKRTLVFAEDAADDLDEMGRATTKALKKRFRVIDAWRYERPEEAPNLDENEMMRSSGSGDESSVEKSELDSSEMGLKSLP